MGYYPIFVEMKDKPCLVVGGGEIGLQKARGLLAAEARITVVSPELHPTLADWVTEGRITHWARGYRPDDAAGFAVVMVATDDRSANARVRAESRTLGAWVNAADDPDNCDFILPSVVRRGSITIGISTGGGSPAMARRVREELEAYFTEDFEPLAELLAEVRAELKQRGVLLPIPQSTWQAAIDGRLRALLAQRRRGQAKALLLSRLGAPVLPQEPPPGHPVRDTPARAERHPMTLLAAGISHRTASVRERERFALNHREAPLALQSLLGRFGNGVVLSTCNRVELYINSQDPAATPADLIAHLSEFKGLDDDAPLPRFYQLTGSETAAHLFRVAAGVDSMVLGEGQILGQVRRALQGASRAGSLDPVLSRLFHSALETGKRCRHETDIARFAVSVSSAAVDLARDQIGSLAGKRALVVGAGEAGKLAARALRDAGVHDLAVTGRTTRRSEKLALELQGSVVPFAELTSALANADIVIGSSAAAGFVIDRARLEEALARREAPIMLIDVAVPRDVDPAVRDLPGVKLFDIDDLQFLSEANLRLREQGALQAQRIVDVAAEQFRSWVESRRAVPAITALLDRAEAIRRAETDRTARELELDRARAEKLDRMTAAIVKKLLHEPILALKNGEVEGDAVRQLFALEER